MKKEINLLTENGMVYATSREIAKNFEKEHSKVIRSIENIMLNEPSQNWLRYFVLSEYKDAQGKLRKEYFLNHDGFSLVAMGFTGAKALQFKLDYINKFNEMELQLKEINDVMKVKGEMSLEDYNKIRFSEKRTINTFADCSIENIKQLVEEFSVYAETLDTKTRVVRCKSAVKGIKKLHDRLARENLTNIGDCYNLLKLQDVIKTIAHITENRHRGQQIAHRNKKIKELEEQVV